MVEGDISQTPNFQKNKLDRIKYYHSKGEQHKYFFDRQQNGEKHQGLINS